MNATLPEKVEPLKLAHKNASLQGRLPIKKLPRLANDLYSAAGDVLLSLSFGVDAQRICYMKGEVVTELDLVCQRCLEPVKYPVKSEFCLSPVCDEKAIDKLPDCYEPLILKDNLVALAEIVEEELLLNIPMAPKHPDGECKATKKS